MKQYYRYDENGCYVEPVIADYGDDLPDDITDIRPPDGLYRAQFDGTAWIETGEPPEEQEQQPSMMDLIADIYARLAEAEIAPVEEMPMSIRESISLATERIMADRQIKLLERTEKGI